MSTQQPDSPQAGSTGQCREIAHGLDNALTPIIAFSELLLRSPQSLDDREKVKHSLQVIHDSAAQAAEWVKRLRQVSDQEDPHGRFSGIIAGPGLRGPASSVPPRRILIVDDAPVLLALLKEILTSNGHRVETATCAREGLEKFQADQFDLLMTDWAMPQMNGEELALAVKLISPETPVILLTSFADGEQVQNHKPLGVDFIMTKPFLLAELHEAITRLTAARSSAREISPPTL